MIGFFIAAISKILDGRTRGEQIDFAQVHQARVCCRQHMGNHLLGEPPTEDEILEFLLFCEFFEPLTFGPVPHQEERDIVATAIAEPLRSLNGDIEPGSHPNGADVGAGELIPYSVLPERVRRLARPEDVPINTVGDHRDFCWRHSLATQVFSISLANRDDVICGCIESAFQPVQKTKQVPILHRPNRDDTVGPQIANLEHERHASNPRLCREHASPSTEELRRRGNHDIGPSPKPRSQNGHDHVGDEIQDPSDGTSVGGEITPDPGNADAVEHI
jgi:hypothetical protein